MFLKQESHSNAIEIITIELITITIKIHYVILKEGSNSDTIDITLLEPITIAIKIRSESFLSR